MEDFSAEDARAAQVKKDDSYAKAIEQVKESSQLGSCASYLTFELSTAAKARLLKAGFKLSRESNPNNMYQDYWVVAW